LTISNQGAMPIVASMHEHTEVAKRSIFVRDRVPVEV